MTNTDGSAPHARLYTRLRSSQGKGVGVFAIREIPQGLDPFLGDGGGTALVPRAVVERIEDAELRQVYLDFCPLVGEHYLAPVDFNRMTIAWYMNHSDQPNVVADPDVNFVAACTIGRGEELTVDYRTFSDHAGQFIARWRTPDDP